MFFLWAVRLLWSKKDRGERSQLLKYNHNEYIIIVVYCVWYGNFFKLSLDVFSMEGTIRGDKEWKISLTPNLYSTLKSKNAICILKNDLKASLFLLALMYVLCMQLFTFFNTQKKLHMKLKEYNTHYTTVYNIL